jgi:cytochrome P450
VHWHPEADGPGFWALTRYDDVVAVSRDAQTFSSWAGGTMVADSPPEFLAGMRLMMLNMDPPQHTKLRALVNKGFTPRMVAGIDDRVRGLARRIVDAAWRMRLVADVMASCRRTSSPAGGHSARHGRRFDAHRALPEHDAEGPDVQAAVGEMMT